MFRGKWRSANAWNRTYRIRPVKRHRYLDTDKRPTKNYRDTPLPSTMYLTEQDNAEFWNKKPSSVQSRDPIIFIHPLILPLTLCFFSAFPGEVVVRIQSRLYLRTPPIPSDGPFLKPHSSLYFKLAFPSSLSFLPPLIYLILSPPIQPVDAFCRYCSGPSSFVPPQTQLPRCWFSLV